MRQAARTDGNHERMRLDLQAAGMCVQSLAAVGQGVPDLLVGYRGVNVLLEVKDPAQPPGKRALTAAQQEWHATWGGQVEVVETSEQAINAVLRHVGAMV